MSFAARARRFAGLCTICAVALSTSAMAPALSQEISEGHLKAARAAIAAIKMTDRFDNILPAAAVALKTELLRKNPNLETLIDETVDEKTLAMASRRGDLEREAAAAYARVFSEDELNAIAAFYATPAGAKLLDKGPEVTAEVFKAAEIWQRGIVRDLAQSVGQTLDAKAPPVVDPAAATQPATNN